MDHRLYTSTLSENISGTKSYNISNLVYVAFFGGIIAISVLGIQNAIMLRLEKKYIRILVAISIIFFIAKYLILSIILFNQIETRSIKYIIQGMGVVVYIFYYAILKRPYHDHLTAGGDTEVLYKKGILWCVIAMIIEAVLIGLLLGLVFVVRGV